MFRILTREAYITSEGNITPEEHISFRESGTHRSKTKRTSYEVRFVLTRVDKKDATLENGKSPYISIFLRFEKTFYLGL